MSNWRKEPDGDWRCLWHKDNPFLKGSKIVSDRHVPDFEMVRRTWRERLLSWPWRPWKSRKAVPARIGYWLENEKTLIVSPKTLSSLETSDDKG